ncbi:MAG: TonB C-terminal domain-containing protein [Burkholderiaceae bacterium]|nr:TonB C-terminal domain-containing protein [Burkholderiaceae bacterium]
MMNKRLLATLCCLGFLCACAHGTPLPASVPSEALVPAAPVSVPEPVPTEKVKSLADIALEVVKADAAKSKQEKPAINASASPNSIVYQPPVTPPSYKAKIVSAYFDKLRDLLRHNMSYPDDGTDNPEAVFFVTLLPDMSVMSATLKKTSGNPAFDDAVRRAILHTRYYPALPPDMEFSLIRQHTLKYRLREE